MNIAIVENKDGTGRVTYQARYFGFDFSSTKDVMEKTFKKREKMDFDFKAIGPLLKRLLLRIFWKQYDFDTGKENFILSR